MANSELKAAVGLPEEAINQKSLALLEGHPGYWQTRQIFPLLFTAFPDLSATIDQQTVDGEWVTTRSTLQGTHLGEFMGIAPTGKNFRIMNISLDQVVEGRVVEHFGVTEWHRALAAFGIMPPAPLTGAETRK